MKESNKIVGIHISHFAANVFTHTVLFLILWLITSIIASTATNGSSMGFVVAFIGSLFVYLILLLQDILYFRKTGIYVENGHHVVRFGGLSIREEKILNTVVISSQVTRSILEQLFGTATIQVGMLGNDKIQGIIYSDLKKYEELMSSGQTFKNTTLF